jgi:hypothetical protein
MRNHRNHTLLLIALILLSGIISSKAQDPDSRKGNLLYDNPFSANQEVSDWIMEGPGNIEFKEGWMEMYSQDEKFHHVLWCPKDFPASFIAEWEAQDLETDAGLCILFFAAKGKNGKDIFNPSFPKRDGTFNDYTKSKYLNCYHISYYANGRDEPGREISHLRKNSGFHLAQEKVPGIPVKSTAVHHLTLVKDGASIIMYVDERKIIDWTDDGKEFGPVLQEGKIGFRQMKWTRFRYRNFKVWEIIHQQEQKPQ